MEIDTANKFIVGACGNGVVLMNPPRGPMTKDDALNLAAWLVALADDDDSFPAVLEAIQNT